MKVYKKVMDVTAFIEKLVLVLTFLLIVALTFCNVVARKVFHHSWGFTEEIVVAVFVLLSLLAVGLAARSGELVNLSLLPDHIHGFRKKVIGVISNIFCLIYAVILTYEGVGRVMADHTTSPILHINKSIFWGFIVVGGLSMIIHFIENTVELCLGKAEGVMSGEKGIYLEEANEMEESIEKADNLVVSGDDDNGEDRQ